jgi:hypothetical protein
VTSVTHLFPELTQAVVSPARFAHCHPAVGSLAKIDGEFYVVQCIEFPIVV